MLVRFHNPHTNVLKQTVILLGKCKITIHRDLRNVLVLLWVEQAAKITMQNVAGNPYTGEMRRCINAGSFSRPITNVLKQTVILLGKCKITIHRDLRNALVLLWVVRLRNNHGCRQGNPYTGEMRRCINAGSFSRIYK